MTSSPQIVAAPRSLVGTLPGFTIDHLRLIVAALALVVSVCAWLFPMR
jgi:hypothetical protein